MPVKKLAGGFIPPPPSPYLPDGTLDTEALSVHCERLLKAGADGFYLCGGTGDAEKLLQEERRLIAGLLVPHLKQTGKTAIVHVGQANLRTALTLAGHAGNLGADAIASIPPRSNWDGITLFYRQLAAVGLPVLIYYFPGVSGVSGGFAEMARLLEIPGVAGVKISDWNIFLIRQMKAAYPEKTYFTGFDEILLPGLMQGADGSIGTWGNLFPTAYKKILSLAADGCWTEAEGIYRLLADFLADSWQYSILALFEALLSSRGFYRCFRTPDYGDPSQIPQQLVQNLLTRIDEIEAAARAM